MKLTMLMLMTLALLAAARPQDDGGDDDYDCDDFDNQADCRAHSDCKWFPYGCE
ncbi:uncharacterized protein L969DRAFT_17622 [Mixia osmundae IAM 14324]|uniref:CBM1 domain-containing protein n=1 Tax=Mixia osmundae (strain CBS 9802 / IAM 14324 / JCM 22182 / KY 12970) TaxID=764103 RepID=G7E453_MIXOS|nr:uncharacterized protein L969DRAFT_17622 [Mixia osmundae IAM 14324]KEI39708.1 hypothetical protein L969DRAFT_17622 [Mixia osmundae IAM 14324]GAA97613.1 hypothetical protein E5Q_04291 [Mixia osmundae IAM 14324]